MSLPPTPSSTEAFVRPWGTADGPRSASSAGPDSPTRLRTSSESGPSSPPRAYRSHPGCSLCTLVSYPARPDGLGLAREILRDDRVIVYEADERARAASGGHLVVVLNDHADSVYELGPADVPLLSHILALASSLLPDSSSQRNTRIGFITQFKDSYFPRGHLHAHILSGPLDKASFWRRNGPYGPMGWYELEDLIAEIRESTSNNRIKSGYGDSRRQAPISSVPDAGSRSGKPNADTGMTADSDQDFRTLPVGPDERMSAQIERPDSAAGLLRPAQRDPSSEASKGKGKETDG